MDPDIKDTLRAVGAEPRSHTAGEQHRRRFSLSYHGKSLFLQGIAAFLDLLDRTHRHRADFSFKRLLRRVFREQAGKVRAKDLVGKILFFRL